MVMEYVLYVLYMYELHMCSNIFTLFHFDITTEHYHNGPNIFTRVVVGVP